jgi:hypothetical protein
VRIASALAAGNLFTRPAREHGLLGCPKGLNPALAIGKIKEMMLRRAM